ncbi:MAG: UDP-2,3-diacylglucosamine diphosphatase [Bacteroidota bacterium]|nr:UDP-2,3-diacylglucosamine diphosphatase [Bacteroidota bacterium]
MNKEKIYFASDFHLGSPNIEESHKREKRIVSWLTEIEEDARAVYLVGDIFDFWFEYKKVVPKGFVRLLGKLAALTDNGTQIHLFVGNHDLWMKDYLEKEVGITIHHKATILEEQGKKIFIAHGDGLGEGDYFYKFIRKIFTSKICQWAFTRLHPNLALYLAHTWSNNSRKNHNALFVSEEEILFNYCKKQQEINPVNYYIFGHRHVPLELKLDNNITYINLGDWITHNTYSVLEKGELKLEKYNK